MTRVAAAPQLSARNLRRNRAKAAHGTTSAWCSRGFERTRKALARRQAYGPLNDLRKLRNRIAHHEPIFARRLLEDHQRILDVTGWFSPPARTWIERHSRVPLLRDASHCATDVRF